MADPSTDYITNLLANIGQTGQTTTANTAWGTPQTIGNAGNGTYSYNGMNGNYTPDQIAGLLAGTQGAGIAHGNIGSQSYNDWASSTPFGANAPTFEGTGKPLTYADIYNNPQDSFGGNGQVFAKPTAADLGAGAMYPGFGQFLGKAIPIAASIFDPYVGAGFAALQSGAQGNGILGALGAGALSLGGSLGGSALSGAVGAGAGSALDYGIQGGVGAAAGAGQSALTGDNPLYGALGGAGKGAFSAYGGINQLSNDTGYTSLNPFSDSASNVASNVTPTNLGTAANTAPLGVAAAAPSGGFLSDMFGSSSPANNISGVAGGNNISGAGNTGGSLFDQAGSYIANNPLTTATGLLAAGAGLNNALSSSSTPTSNLGSSLSSFTPSQQPGLAAPADLANYTNSALSPDQTLSGIATKGVYGGGLGPQEQQYFLNLVNNRLVDQTGKVANDTSSLNPVENSYLSQLGLGGYSNPTDLLRGISQYAA